MGTSKSDDQTHALYLEASPFPEWGAFGFGDISTNQMFEVAWPKFLNHLRTAGLVSESAPLREFSQDLRYLSNNYIYSKNIFDRYDAATQKKTATKFVKSAKEISDLLECLVYLNIPSFRGPSSKKEYVRGFIANLREIEAECLNVSESRVKPGAAAATYVYRAVQDFISIYERHLDRKFEISKTMLQGRGGKGEFTSIGPRCMQVFFEAIDPKYSRSKLATAIQYISDK